MTDAPIPMILHCPKCGTQHVDKDDHTGKWATERHHKKHLCLNEKCNHLFRPANVFTVGVRTLECMERHVDRYGDVHWCSKDLGHDGHEHETENAEGVTVRWSVW